MNRPLRLLLTIRKFYPSYSGAGQRFQGYAQGLRARGIEMEVLSAVEGEQHLQRLPSLEIDGLQIHQIGVKRGWNSPEHGFATLLRCLREPPDVVQAMAESLLSPWFLGLGLAQIPVVINHTMMGIRVKTGLKGLLQPLWWRLPFQLTQAAVVNSQAMAAALAELKISSQVIPNGVNLQRFYPSAPEERAPLRARLGLPPDGPLLVSLGGLNPRKSHDLMLAAFLRLRATHPQARLLIAGPPGPSAHVASLRRFISREGLSEAVQLPGMIKEVPELLRAADLFCFSSRVEGLPNAVLEAMATGLPVVLTRFLGLSPELGEAGRHYLLRERSSEALAEGMDRLLSKPEEAQAMGAAARTWIAETLSLEKSLDLYANLYQRMAQASQLRRSR